MLLRLFTAISFIFLMFSCSVSKRQTIVSIKQNQFYINGEPTYKGRFWQENKIEGLLLNSRMVQGVFDDLNPLTKEQFVYADTKKWDPKRNTNEFIAAMKTWKSYGLLAFTLNLQGGSPLGYGNKGWINSAFEKNGDLNPTYLRRLEKILTEADKLGMVVILGYFYFGQDEYLTDEKAVLNAVDNISNWILKKKYKNVLVEINNECDIFYDHKILQTEKVHELINRVKAKKYKGFNLLVSTSFSGGKIPSSNVVSVSDFVLLHANGVEDKNRVSQMVSETKGVKGYENQPIVFNEDDHFEFEKETNNFTTAIKSYASWGYFDYRMKNETFVDGYQSIPVDWGVNSVRKKGFFNKLKEITGY
jgi:hypothetical protein